LPGGLKKVQIDHQPYDEKVAAEIIGLQEKFKSKLEMRGKA